VARTTQNTTTVEQRWIEFMTRAYAKNHADIITKGTNLAEAVVSSLEIFISKRVQDEADQEEEGEEGQGEDALELDEEELHEADEAGRSEEFSGRAPLLEKVYGLIIDAFQAWCEYAEAVLDKCKEGTYRAKAAVLQARSPYEKEFERVSQL